MIISLSEIMNLKGVAQEFEADLEMVSYTHMGVEYPIVCREPVKIRLSGSSANKVLLESEIVMTLEGACDRCMEPVRIPFDIKVSHLLHLNEEGRATADDDEEEISYVDGYGLLVDAFVNEEIMIGFPMKVLCNDDCKGICKICGANLNKGECGCDRTEPDPRMSIIRDIFNQKEV